MRATRWASGRGRAADAPRKYATNLTAFIKQIRSDFDTPDMPFVVGRIRPDWGAPDNNALVRAAEETVPGRVGGASWIDTDDLQIGTAPRHYGTRGQIDLGTRFARALAPKPSGPHRDSFSFLHSYEATGRYWRGLEKAGLLRPTNGIRLVNSPWGDDARRFNEVARVGGPLHRILEQRKCCFVVDRVVGGSPYNPYKFDVSLVDHYAAMLGAKFLGGQVHETISNIHNDWGRFRAAGEKFATQPVALDEARPYFTRNDAAHKLEYGTLEDYAGRVHFNSPETLWNEIRWAVNKQAARFGAHFSYCEGSGYGELAWHAFYKFGAAYGLAEVGVWASSQSQFAIAGLRGAAKAANKPWGVFFAPWGPSGCTSFVPAKDVSWQCDEEFLANTGWPAGPQLGCSSALQRRIFFHSYLSGAHTLHEEWGAEGNLLDWEEGKLSSYGKATQEFLNFQDAHPDVGVPYTPIALVLDASIPPVDAAPWAKLKERLFRYADVDRSNETRKGKGNAEVACYPPCALPELFDIVPSDAPKSLWETYEEIIPVGRAPVPRGAAACPSEQVYDRLAAAVARLSPLKRSTHLPMQINRRQSDGAWIIALYNPWGACRGDVGDSGSILDEGCTTGDTLQPKFTVKSIKTIFAWPNSSTASLRGNKIHITVGPGGTLVLEVVGQVANLPGRAGHLPGR